VANGRERRCKILSECYVLVAIIPVHFAINGSSDGMNWSSRAQGKQRAGARQGQKKCHVGKYPLAGGAVWFHMARPRVSSMTICSEQQRGFVRTVREGS
jgi:hypothetical protein